MIRLLAYTSPARGHLYPVVPIVAELTRRGHRASLYTLAGELEHLAPLGIEGSAIDPSIEAIQIEDWRARSPLGAIRSVMRTFVERSAHEAPDLQRAIAHCDPDVLLIDINCWGAATVAEASGLPWAMYSPYLLPLPSRDAPPYGPGLRPMSGPLGAVRDALVGRVGERISFQRVMPQVNSLRAQHDLPALARFTELLERPAVLLSLTAEGFEYPHSDWPTNVQLVGPMNWSPSGPSHANESWLSGLGDPLVLVTCSTERQRDKRLLHVALEALPAAGISVLGTTAAHDPEEFHAPAGSRVVRFASHEAILGGATCVVCHGGLGITQKALSAGVPVVVVPFGRDQAETARRVELARAGVRLSPRRLTPARLLRAVRMAIDLHPGTQCVSQAFAAAGGPPAAADAIEALASTPREQDARPPGGVSSPRGVRR
jgi:MGT family glycosyltransferase